MSDHSNLSEEREEVFFILKCVFLSTIFLINHVIFLLLTPGEEFTQGITVFLAAAIIFLPIIAEAKEHFMEGKFGMNELVLIAMAACCAQYQYLEAAIIGIIMSLHEVIEHWTPSGSTSSLQDALKLHEKEVVRLNSGKQEKVKASELLKGDIIQVLPGEVFTVDGKVQEGNSTVDKSSITGESIPVDVAVGSQILAGTSNLTGVVTLEVSAAINETVISHLDKIMAEARESKSEVVSLMDKLSAPYAMCALAACLVVFFFTKNADQAIALLIVSFPDALVMAAPLAMLAALTSCARCGLLLKTPGALLKVSNCLSIFMDKTGTLSQGKLTVKEIHIEDEYEKKLVNYSVALAKLSNHPVSSAIASLKVEKEFKVSNFKEEHGLGISGTVKGSEISIGRYKWIQQIDKSLSLQLPSNLSMSVVVIDGKFAGFFKLEDNLKTETPGVISLLQKDPLTKIKIISGDLISRVKKIAQDLKVDYTGECLPTDKVKEIQKAAVYSDVMFVGDGLNDAPAMAVADVGVSMKGSGNELTTGNADVVLLRNDLSCIPYLKNLSARTNAIITQNMICGVVFVILGIFLAATEVLTPAYAAVFHLLDATFIVFNSARLIKVNLPE
ncbi:MAG: cadmium-translocating P-type ATPase [Lentisphaeraceae bacterium]|nr:cadmium-translocating P-type ATPase [Lentisphaeraceae bacterium]